MPDTGKREFIKTETIDFGSIATQTTAEAVVETGLTHVLAAAVNPPDGFEADLVVSAYAVPARNEVQNLTNDGTGGTFNLTFDGQVTAEIAFDATAAALESALEALSNIEDVVVTLNGAQDWDIEFLNPGISDVPALVPDDTNMTGQITGSVVTETTKGRAPGTVLVRAANISGGPIDPASQDFNIVCWY